MNSRTPAFRLLARQTRRSTACNVSRRYSVSSLPSSWERAPHAKSGQSMALLGLVCLLGAQFVVPALWMQSAIAAEANRQKSQQAVHITAVKEEIKAQEARNPKAPSWYVKAQRHEQEGMLDDQDDIQPSAPLYDPNPHISLKALDFSNTNNTGLDNANPKAASENNQDSPQAADGVSEGTATVNPNSSNALNGKIFQSGGPSVRDIQMSGGDCGALVPQTEADPTKAAAVLSLEELTPATPEVEATRARRAANIKNLATENLSFARAMQTWNEKKFQPAVTLLQKHVQQYPDSPWAIEAKLHIADDAQFTGKYSDAVATYNQVFYQTLGADGGRPKPGTNNFELHYKTIQKWAAVNLTLGRFDEAQKQVDEIAAHDPHWRRWTWANYWQNKLQLFQKNRLALHTCGGMALYAALQELGKNRGAEKLITQNAPQAEGYSLSQMVGLGRQYGVEFKGFRARPEQLAVLPMPLIIHCDFHASENIDVPTYKSGSVSKRVQTVISASMHDVAGMDMNSSSAPSTNKKTAPLVCPTAGDPDCATCRDAAHGHYFVVQRIDVKKGLVYLFNPQVQASYVLSYRDLAKEWSGTGLVAVPRDSMNVVQARLAQLQTENTQQKVSSSTRFAWLSEHEMKSIRGGCFGPGLTSGGGGDGPMTPVRTDCGGAEPRISVNMISQNMWITDTPIWSKPAIGPGVRIIMNFSSQDSTNFSQPFGNKWSLNYGTHPIENTAGAVNVFMPDGRQDFYTPDGGVGTFTAPVGVYNKLVKLATNSFELRFPMGGKYVYGVPAGTTSTRPLLTRIEDRWGKALVMGYDTSLNLKTITDATGGVMKLNYDANGRIIQATEPTGRFATWQYDANGNMVQVTDVEGHAFQYTYDATVNVTRLNTAQGAWTSSYATGTDGHYGYRTTLTDPLGQSEVFEFNSSHADQYYAHTDKRGYKTKTYAGTVIDGKGRITATVAPNGDTSSVVYDAVSGQPSSVTDAGGRTATYTYNAMGRLLTAKDAKNHTKTLVYNANNLDVVTVKDALNNTVATFTYDAFHMPLSATNALNQTTSATYTNWGAVATSTDAANRVTTVGYNSNGTVSNVSRDGIQFGSYTYDNANRVLTATSVDGLTLTYSYDNLDHVKKVVYPDGTYSTVDYVCCGMPGSTQDRNGKKSYYDYDPLKRLVRVQDAAGNSVSYDYDPNGNMVRLLDSRGSSTRLTYDSLNRVTNKSYPDGRSDSLAYNVVSNTISRTNAKGKATTSYYDAAGNLTAIGYTTMPAVTFYYDALDRVASMTDALGTRTFGYDALNRVTSTGGIYTNDTVTYHYDNLGRRDGMAVQNGGTGTPGTFNLSYAYDALSRLGALTSPSGTWNYSYVGNTGRVSQFKRPNNSVTTYSYDGLDRLTQVQNGTGAVSGDGRPTFPWQNTAVNSKYAYAYDTRDVRISMDRTHGSNPTQHVNYGYDTTNQLTSEVATETSAIPSTPYINNTYAYDAMGNRTTTSVPTLSNGPVTSTTSLSNRLNQLATLTTTNTTGGTVTSTRTNVYSYDANGNTTKIGNNVDKLGTSYVYDEADRLTQVIQRGSDGVNNHLTVFTYDGLGRKVVSQEWNWSNGAWSFSSEVRRIYDGLDMIQERDNSNNVQGKYTRVGNIGGVLARRDGNTNDFFYHYDGSGNVVQLTNSSQSTVAEYAYDVYGNITRSTGSQADNNPFRFSTKEWNSAVGLYDFGFRFYNPSLGKWINRDPIREAGGLNIYAAFGNSPTNFGDAYGLWCPTDTMALKMFIPGYGLGATLDMGLQVIPWILAGKPHTGPGFSVSEMNAGGDLGAAATALAMSGPGLIAGGGGAAAAATADAAANAGGGEAAAFGGGRTFNHFTSAEGVQGITGLNPSELSAGQPAIVNVIDLQAGNSFIVGAGRVSVTEIGPGASVGQLARIGVFGDKGNFVIQMSEETLFANGVSPEAGIASRSIYSIPAGTYEGTFRVVPNS